MLDNRIVSMLSDQRAMEFSAYFLYLSFSNFFCSVNSYNGFSAFFAARADEERLHATKFNEYLIIRGANPPLVALPTMPNVSDMMDIFAEFYAQEQRVTAAIKDIFSFARSIDDFATEGFLSSFVAEQVEEENTAFYALSRLQEAEDNIVAIRLFDEELMCSTKKDAP